MRKKKILSMLMVTIMIFLVVGCGSKKSNQSDSTDNAEATKTPLPTNVAVETGTGREIPADVIPEDTVTLTVYDQLANYSGEQIGWFAQVMLEKFNVKLNIIPESEGTFETRMESGNLGDIVIWGESMDQYLQAVDKGMLFDWEEEDILNRYGAYMVQNWRQ